MRAHSLRSLVGFMLCVSATTASAAGRDVPLVEAAKAEDAAAVRALLDNAVDVDSPALDGTTALHWAAYQGDHETARVLLEAGARADLANRYGVTPLTLATGRGDAGIVASLLHAGADPNAHKRGPVLMQFDTRSPSLELRSCQPDIGLARRGTFELDVDAIIKSKEPKSVRLKEPIPVFVEYMTVRTDEQGYQEFFIDIYYLDRLQKAGKKDFGPCTPPPEPEDKKPSDDIGP